MSQTFIMLFNVVYQHKDYFNDRFLARKAIIALFTAPLLLILYVILSS